MIAPDRKSSSVILLLLCIVLLVVVDLDFNYIGVDFALKVINWDTDTLIRLQLWDIAGKRFLLLSV